MGDPLYLADPEHPDERDREVRGIEKTIAAPGDAVRYQLLPVANYVYNGAIWVPEGPGGGLIFVLQQIAQTMEGVDGTLEGTIAAYLNQLVAGGTQMPGALSPPVTSRADQDVVKAWANWQGVPYGNDIGSIEAMVGRKYVAVDAGAYVSPAVADGGGTLATAIQFTGVNLNGRIGYIFDLTDRTFHRATSVVDPAGGAVGTIVVSPPIRSANAVLRIRYSDVPHAWNAAADALQTLAVVGDPPRINGPATFLSVAAAVIANGPTQYVMPTALYARQGIEISWWCAGATLLMFNIYGKVSDAAWPAAGSIPAGYLINAWVQTTPGGVAFGAPPIGGGTAAAPNVILARIQDPTQWNSFAIEMVASASAGASTVAGTYRLAGGTA